MKVRFPVAEYALFLRESFDKPIICRYDDAMMWNTFQSRDSIRKPGRVQRRQRDRIIIFGRYPVPGRVKTRLIPVLGSAGAADLHRRLMEQTFTTAIKVASKHGMGVEICFDGGSPGKIKRWLGRGPILSHQGPGDLGRRMQDAFTQAFRSGCGRVVLVGTDIPALTSDHLMQAFDALTGHDIVFGPSVDGGYWLIGLRRPVKVFRNIDWGTDRVLSQTIAMVNEQGYKFHLLDRLRDIDTGDDLKEWRPEEATLGPYISIVIPTLNEAENVESAISRSWNADTEIIVADGGSSDDTRERAAANGAQVVSSPPGRALQQNRGASSACGRVILFLHADTLLPSDYVDHVFETLMDPNISVGAFRFKTDLQRPMMKIIECIANMRSEYFGLPYGDQGLFLRKSMFTSVGGFPDTPIAEDLFLVRRLAKWGSVCIAPAHVITSARRWTTFGLLRTTLTNCVILAGCYLGVSPHRLASLYGTLPGKS